MGWFKKLYSRIAPASKGQLNAKTVELEKKIERDNQIVKKDILSELAKNNQKLQKQMKKMDSNMVMRLERIERLLTMQSYGVTEKKREQQIIVSMTSYGKRVAAVPLVLYRLMNQTVKPDRIILYLSKENFPEGEAELPQQLLDMCNRGLEIHWCEGDIKSYKKLIPALQEFPEDIIITVDDDLYYELDVVERLYDSYRRYPGAISALRAHKMEFDDKGQLLPYAQWSKCVSEPLKMPSMKLFATTGGGTLFPPHIFPAETFNQNVFMRICGNADDVWFKLMSAMNCVPTVLADANRKLQYIDGTQQESLWMTNQHENDMQLQSVLEEYHDYTVDGKHIMEMIYEAEV